MSRVRLRLTALLVSLISIAASFAFSIAVTRKLPLVYLGVLNVFNGAIIFGSLPIGIVSFMSPRLSAKYGKLSFGLLFLSFILALFGSAISVIFLLDIKSRIPESYFFVLALLTVLSIITNSFGSSFSSGLTVFNRSRLIFSSLVSSLVKLASILYIMRSNWSLQSVMISTFIINLSGVVYSLASVKPYLGREASFRRLAKEFFSGSWVSLIGYASNNIRSIDSFVIASVGGIQDNALWQVLGVIGSAYSFRGLLFNITYGELLEKGERVRRIYYDLLFVLSSVTLVSVFIIIFEPQVIAFLRPTNLYLIKVLYVPVALWALTNIVNTFSQYLSNVMQGVERVDFTKEIDLKTYWKSLVFYAHFAEFINTVSYVGLILPAVFALKAFSVYLYVIDGVILASLISIIIAVAIRLKTYKEFRDYVKIRELLPDYFVPLFLSFLILLLIRPFLFRLMPVTVSAYLGLLRLSAFFLITALIYYGLSALISKRVRLLAKLLVRSLFSI